MHEQLELPLFPPEDFKSLLARMDIDSLAVTINPRLKQSWRARIDRFSGRCELYVPVCCADAPYEIKEALINWALLVFKKRSKKNRALIKQTKHLLEQSISGYIKARGFTPRYKKIDTENAASKTQGEKYDLKELFNAVNAAYFGNEIKAYVRWGSPRSRTSYQSVRSDKNSNRINMITIAGIYNHPDVPRFAIEGVMFHEMAHIKAAPFKHKGRNIIHGREFKLIERSFPHYEQWAQWEKRDLPGIYRRIFRKSSHRRFFNFF